MIQDLSINVTEENILFNLPFYCYLFGATVLKEFYAVYLLTDFKGNLLKEHKISYKK